MEFTEYLRYKFTRAELEECARQLAQATARRGQLEQQKKEVDASLKAQIEAEVSGAARYSQHINNGWEYRDIPCSSLLDVPSKGQKTIVRLDNQETVRVVAMTDEDRQAALKFEDH